MRVARGVAVAILISGCNALTGVDGFHVGPADGGSTKDGTVVDSSVGDAPAGDTTAPLGVDASLDSASQGSDAGADSLADSGSIDLDAPIDGMNDSSSRPPDSAADTACSADPTMDPQNCGFCGHGCLGGGCKGGLCQPVTMATLTGQPAAIAVDGQFVYVTSDEADGGGYLDGIPVAGGAPTLLASGLNLPGDIVLSPSSVYFATAGSGQGILVLPKGGGDAGVFLPGTTASDRRLAIDAVNVSWTNTSAQIVAVSTFAGAEVNLATSGALLQGIAADGTSLYWLDGADGGALMACPESTLAAANVRVVVAGNASPLDIGELERAVHGAHLVPPDHVGRAGRREQSVRLGTGRQGDGGCREGGRSRRRDDRQHGHRGVAPERVLRVLHLARAVGRGRARLHHVARPDARVGRGARDRAKGRRLCGRRGRRLPRGAREHHEGAKRHRPDGPSRSRSPPRQAVHPSGVARARHRVERPPASPRRTVAAAMQPPRPEATPRDADPSHAAYLEARPRLYRGFTRTSQYLVMRDGTRIAIDVCLPRGLSGVRVPTIVRQTRYFRRFRVHPATRPFLGEATLDPMNAPMRALFTSRGYAWVDVDARGSGASFGERPCPWYLEGEVKDGAEIVDFIVHQPWSNGLVGSTGVSYDGTTAEFLAANRHPAVAAIAPRFSLFDVYADVAFPGGLHQSWFTETWERANAALDRNAPGEFIAVVLSFALHGSANPRVVIPGSLPNLLARTSDRADVQRWAKAVLTWALGGVPPVDEDGDGAVLAQAIASHGKNWNVDEGAVLTTFRDDSPPNSPLPGFTSEAFSPKTYVGELGDVAVLSYGGWFDSGYANAAARRQQALTGARNELLLGPWVHGGALVMDPDGTGPAKFDHAAELLRFFDRHLLRDRPADAAPQPAPVRYFMMGEGAWRSSTRWPPLGTRSVPLHFAEGHRLGRSPGTGIDVHEVDPKAGAGRRSRWRTLVSPFLHADGAGRSVTGLLTYETEPLGRDVEVIGHPVLVVQLSSSTPDGAIFAYVDDVDREGKPRLVTEGQLRTIHRTRLLHDPEGDSPARVDVSFLRRDALSPSPSDVVTHAIELYPLAMLFRRGHRIRLSLAGADVDHFRTPASTGPTVWRVHRAGSRLLLPQGSRSEPL